MAIKRQGKKNVDLPEVTSAQRSTEKGRIQFNVTTGLAEYYDGTQWKSIDSPPSVSSISPTSILESQLASNVTVVITGSNFSTSVTVKIIGNDGTEIDPASTTRNSNTQVTITTPTSGITKTNEPYDIKVTNLSGLAGTLPDAMSVNDGPVWSTAAGSLGTLADDGRAVSNLTTSTLVATDEESDAVTYAVTSGSLPSGVSLASNGALSGTAASGSATYNFTVTATSTGGTAARAFSIVVTGPPFMSATGGTITTDGDYKVHTFTTSGTFTPTVGTDSTYGTKVEYLVVAGGGGGGHSGHGAGGGAGGYRHNSAYDFVVSNQAYSITVGGKGASKTTGGNSTFSNITSAGGGRGGHNGTEAGQAGGSGGGGSGHVNDGAGGAGNTPSVSPSQGNNGGSGQDGSPRYGAGGGGGAGSTGSNGSSSSSNGTGGNGSANDIHGSSRTYSAGGGGHSHGGSNSGGSSGLGGHSQNASGGRNTSNAYGMGGGGDNENSSDGVVIIRYKFQ